MSATGFCTLEDVRRALRKANLPGDIDQDNRIAVDAIVAQTEPLEKRLDRYWYADANDDIVSEATEVSIPQSTTSREDEYDIPSHGGFVHGGSERDRHRWRRNSDALLEAGPRHERRRTHDRVRKQEIRIATGDPSALTQPVDDTIPAYTRITLARKEIGRAHV